MERRKPEIVFSWAHPHCKHEVVFRIDEDIGTYDLVEAFVSFADAIGHLKARDYIIKDKE